MRIKSNWHSFIKEEKKEQLVLFLLIWVFLIFKSILEYKIKKINIPLRINEFIKENKIKKIIILLKINKSILMI